VKTRTKSTVNTERERESSLHTPAQVNCLSFCLNFTNWKSSSLEASFYVSIVCLVRSTHDKCLSSLPVIHLSLWFIFVCVCRMMLLTSSSSPIHRLNNWTLFNHSFKCVEEWFGELLRIISLFLCVCGYWRDYEILVKRERQRFLRRRQKTHRKVNVKNGIINNLVVIIVREEGIFRVETSYYDEGGGQRSVSLPSFAFRIVAIIRTHILQDRFVRTLPFMRTTVHLYLLNILSLNASCIEISMNLFVN